MNLKEDCSNKCIKSILNTKKEEKVNREVEAEIAKKNILEASPNQTVIEKEINIKRIIISQRINLRRETNQINQFLNRNLTAKRKGTKLS